MANEQVCYYMKLNPPRESFMVDMQDHEKDVMYQHMAYWRPYVSSGTVIVLGPVMMPNGGFGIAIVQVNDFEAVQKLIADDPANGLCTYECYPMQAVSKFL